MLILEPLVGAVASNLEPGSEGLHQILDLGADEFTVGRAHPMLDPGARIEAIARAGKDPEVAVLLLDVVLGYGVSADPAGDIAPAVEAACAEARAHGRGLAVVATVVGTRDDPQGLAGQLERLEAAGAWVLPSNAEAVRAAARIATAAPSLGMTTIGDLLSSEVRVINLGIEHFAIELERLGVPVIHVQWSPPAGGDARKAALLTALADEEDQDA